jgi:hypothetical protein
MSSIYAVVNNNTIQRIGRVKALWPQVSFADAGPREDWLIAQGAQPIRYDPPYDPDTQQLQPTAPYLLNGVVYAMEAVSRPAPEPQPEWVAFGAALLADPAVNQMLGALISIGLPAIAMSVSVGLGKAADGDSRVFVMSWAGAHDLGLIPADLIEHVQGLATAYNLPAEFIAGLAAAK